MPAFQDNFSKQAEIYSKYRPMYPESLFEYLQSLTTEHTLAWDCGTGNGQSAINLTKYYKSVYATDPSEQQINNAIQDECIIYKVEKAEKTQLNDRSVDLITVAQAVHWFDFEQFYAEVKRVLKQNGIIAVWAYGVPSVSAAIDPITQDFHDNILGAFWQDENRLIDKEYTTIPFPFKIIATPQFYIRKKLTLTELSGHFRSWSATQKFIDKHGTNPVEPLKEQLLPYWENEEQEKEVSWKLILKVGSLTA